MDFNVLRPKPPAKKPEPPKPAPPAAPPAPPPKPPGPPPLPPPPFGMVPPPGPYTEDHLDAVYRMYNPRTVDFRNARTWTLNYDNYSDNFGDYYVSRHPVRIKGPTPIGDSQVMAMMGPMQPQQQQRYQALPPPGYDLGPTQHDYPRYGLPAPNHHYGMPQRLSLPPPEYSHHGPPRHGPEFFMGGGGGNYYDGYQHSYQNSYHGGGGYGSYPSGCVIM